MAEKWPAAQGAVTNGGGAQLTLPERNWCELNRDLEARVMVTH